MRFSQPFLEYHPQFEAEHRFFNHAAAISEEFAIMLRERQYRRVFVMASAMPDESTSASLLLRIRDPQDGESWRIFESIYGPLIRRYCVRRGVQEADAADISQDVLARVARAIRGFDYAPERGRFRSWLGTVTANELSSFFTRHGRQPDSDSERKPSDTPGPDPAWMEEFTAHVLAVASERIRCEFEAPTWEAFEAVWMKQEGPAEAARRLGMPIHSVYVNKSRVLKRLEAEILHLAEDLPQPDPSG
jgi:RNA polymerase sigma-70 factor (ECF subfamily)